jgi:hypothetical protein
VQNFSCRIAIAMRIENCVQARSLYPSRRAIERSPHSALIIFVLAMARTSKDRLDCELLSIAEVD